MELSKGQHATIHIIGMDKDYSVIKVEQDLSSTVYRMTAQEMWDFATELQAESQRLCRLEDEALNARIEATNTAAA